MFFLLGENDKLGTESQCFEIADRVYGFASYISIPDSSDTPHLQQEDLLLKEIFPFYEMINNGSVSEFYSNAFDEEASSNIDQILKRKDALKIEFDSLKQQIENESSDGESDFDEIHEDNFEKHMELKQEQIRKKNEEKK